MTISLIHLSDFHFKTNREEHFDLVVNALFDDLDSLIARNKQDDFYLVFSGDIVQSGDSVSEYDGFIQKFNEPLNRIGIHSDKRICIPGNHDLSRKWIQSNFVEHEGIVSQFLNETQFNDYLAKPANLLTREKFENFVNFEQQFTGRNIGITGGCISLSEDIMLYAANSALCSSGGIDGNDGLAINDKGRLSIETRAFHAWLAKSKNVKQRIFVQHHPLSWLTDWSDRELTTELNKNFSLFLSGHAHDQSSFHSIKNGEHLVCCSAPPLFTTKSDLLGYSVIRLDGEIGVLEIVYRQWASKHHKFVVGGNFSGTDDGRIGVSTEYGLIEKTTVQNTNQAGQILAERLRHALVSFTSQPVIWVSPTLRSRPEIEHDKSLTPPVELVELVRNPRSLIIKAPPQFGLTCLAHYLVREAWVLNNKAPWLYLDAKVIKPHASSIEEAISEQLSLLAIEEKNISCIVLDSWVSHEKEAAKLLERISKRFAKIPLICMQTCPEIRLLGSSTAEISDRQFESLYLWSLGREDVRKVVVEYNHQKGMGDDDAITQKVVSDLEVMNIHRTPLNCLTLLKVSELDFDESPVNRTEMIKRVLFLIFNLDSIPNYKSRPDLKDCEYVLGHFCEMIIKEGDYYFARDHFLLVIQKYCSERLIDLEVHVVFDVLLANGILVRYGSLYGFRFSYWIYYFAAQRMHHDKKFAEYVLSEMRYASFPEIIEFYTGIDRRREDALKVLLCDVKAAVEKVQEKIGLPERCNIFTLGEWTASPQMLERLHSEIKEGIKDSNLPDVVKDRYADRDYDRARPYDQKIREILTEATFGRMLGVTRAAGRALRNSDYADPAIKRQLLQEILRSWEQASNVLLVLLPILADKGAASFDGVGFFLLGDFGGSVEERLVRILVEIPANVVGLWRDDLCSQKMGPLLIEHVGNEKNDLRRHELILLLIRQRPRGWREKVHWYIGLIPKNSFFLMDVYRNLRAQYRYGFAERLVLKDIEYLIKMAAVKHVTGDKEPGVKLINKTLPKMQGDPVVPPREV